MSFGLSSKITQAQKIVKSGIKYVTKDINCTPTLCIIFILIIEAHAVGISDKKIKA